MSSRTKTKSGKGSKKVGTAISSEQQQNLAKSVKKMMRNDVSLRTIKQYGPSQVDFITYCFNNHKGDDVVNKEFFLQPGALDAEGKVCPSFVRESLLKQLEGGDETLCPLNLSKVSSDLVGEYVLFRSQNPRRERDKRDDEPLSDSTVNGWSSAIKKLFTIFNVVPPPEYSFGVSKVKKGYKKQTTEKRRRNVEGKDALPFDLLAWLSMKMLERKEFKEFSFARLFMLLQWNLLCRSSNTEDVAYSHMEWKDDCLLVYFRKQKNDQDGTRSKDPRHVYANPLRPELCPILALGIWLLCCPPSENQTALFDGSLFFVLLF